MGSHEVSVMPVAAPNCISAIIRYSACGDAPRVLGIMNRRVISHSIGLPFECASDEVLHGCEDAHSGAPPSYQAPPESCSCADSRPASYSTTCVVLKRMSASDVLNYAVLFASV